MSHLSRLKRNPPCPPARLPACPFARLPALGTHLALSLSLLTYSFLLDLVRKRQLDHYFYESGEQRDAVSAEQVDELITISRVSHFSPFCTRQNVLPLCS